MNEQRLSPEEKELLDEIYARLTDWEKECRTYHDAARTMRLVMARKDPEQDSTQGGEKTLQLHTLANTVQNCVAEQMERMPEAKLIPEVPENAELAETLQDIVHHVIYNVNGFDAVHRRRMEDFFVTGTSILQVAWDPEMNRGEGDIALIRWPIEAFLWDPQAEDIQDARALMKLSWHPLTWFEDHYPEAAPYIRSEEGEYNRVGMPDSQEKAGSNERRAMLIEYWYRTYDAASRRHAINVAYAAGGALIRSDLDVYAHGEYPFVVDAHSTIEGQPIGEGLVSEFRVMMQYINRYQRYIDTNLRMSSKGRMLVRRNAGIDPGQLADWSRDTIEADQIVRGDAWEWLAHPPLNGMTYTQVQTMETALAQDAGVSSVMRGVLPSDYASGKAVTALQETGSKVSNLKTAGLRAGFRKVVEQMLWLMAQFYKTERVALIVGEDGKTSATHFKPQDFFTGKSPKTPPPYLVQIEINNRNPLRIDQQNEMFMQAYTMAAQAQQQFPLSVLFSLLNIEGKDRVLPVIRETEAQRAQMEQMQAQMEQMQAQMAQSQQENEALKRSGREMASALGQIGAPGGMGDLAGMKHAEGAPEGAPGGMPGMGW